MIKKLLYILLICLLPVLSWGACPSGTCTLADCEYTTVNTAVNTTATYGDTVVCPADTVEWNSTLSITKGITLQGAGSDQTIISGNVGSAQSFINIDPDSYSCTNDILFRVTGFSFDGNTGSTDQGVKISGAGPINKTRFIRIDNNIFREFAGDQEGGVYFNNTIHLGLVDNNTFIDNQRHVIVYGQNSYSWERWGTEANKRGSVNMVYMEDNIYRWTSSYDSVLGAPATYSTGFGASWVSRFNDIDSQKTGLYQQGHDAHGNNGVDTHVNEATCSGGSYSICGSTTDACCTDRRAVQMIEVYNETFTGVIEGSQWSKFVDQRAGAGMIFDNTSNTAYGTIQMSEEDYPDDGICCTGTIANWEDCCDNVRDSYHFSNTKTNGNWSHYEYPNQDIMVEPNYNYWKDNTSFTPGSDTSLTSGIAIGTAAQMAQVITCTENVGFWVTDEGEWDDTNGATPDGRLYICDNSNIFNLFYTPYTYPHPLRSEAGTPPEFSSASLAADGEILSVVFNELVTKGAGYSDTHFNVDSTYQGALTVTWLDGDGTETHRFTLSSKVMIGDTLNIDFDPGATTDTLKDSEGTDLIAFSNEAITNNSTQNPIKTSGMVIGMRITKGE